MPSNDDNSSDSRGVRERMRSFRIIVPTSQRSRQILQKAPDHGVFGVCHKPELDSLLQCVMQASASLQVSP